MAFDPSRIDNRQKIQLTLDSSQITSDQTDFPLTVILDGARPLYAELFAALGDNYKKLSIQSGATQLPVEIESWSSTTEKAVIHTKVPTYSSSVNGELVLAYDATQEDNSYVGTTGDVGSLVYSTSLPTWYSGAENNQTLRFVHAAGSLDSFSNLKLVLGRGSNTYGIVSCWIGYASETGDAYDFDGNQVQVFFDGGNAGTSIITDGQLSDAVNFDYDNTKNLVISITTLTESVQYNTSIPSTVSSFIAAGDYSGDTDVTLRVGTTVSCVSGIMTVTPAQAVWDNNFVAVYHMAQDPSGTAPQILDSTANGLGGTVVGTMTSANLVDGLYGKAINFDGSSNYISIADDDALDITYMTMEAFIYPTSVANEGILCKGDLSNDQGVYQLSVSTAGAGWYYRINGATTENEGSLSGGTPVANNWYYVAGSLSATDQALYVDGALVKTDPQVSTVTASTKPLLIGAYYSSGYTFPGKIGEVRISDIDRSSDWIKLTNLSLTGALVTPTSYTALLTSSLEQPYDISADIIQAILEQSYGVASSININCFQLYSMVLETWITQYYGDVPRLTKPLSQPYGAAAVLQKSLVQRWGEALEMEVDLTQPWSMPDLLQIANEQRYGIVASVLTKTAEQLYNINELTSLFKVSHQAYAIAGDTAGVYALDTKLYIDGERIPYTALTWEASENDYYWSCEATVATKELAVKAVAGAEIRIDWAGESLYLKCYNGWMLTKSFGSASYRIVGCGKAKDLSYAATLSGDVDGGMASDLVTGFAALAGITVDWQMDDGYIKSGKLVANDETPLEMIRKIVWDCQGKLRPTLDGNLIAAYAEEIAVPDYPTVTPADTIVARLERISTSESSDEQYGYNSFTVSDQLASSDSRDLVVDLLDSKTAELREYATPLYDGMAFELTHRGPSSVTIEPFGLVSEEIVDELVSFESGASATSLPIYAITDKSWQTDSLGAVDFAEDGTLESEISGYGLLKISYITKYFKWVARHASITDVLFVADETSEETV